MPAAATFLQSANNNTSQTIYTYSAQNLGTVSSDRHIVLVFACRASGTTALTVTATIAGVSATSVVTQAASAAGNLNRVAMFIAAVPTGASGDIVVTCSRSALRSLIAAYSVTGISSATASATATSTAQPANGVITIPADGIAIAGAINANGTAYTWTNLTERSDDVVNTNFFMSTASDAFATLQTSLSITASPVISTDPAAVFAAWSPSAGASGGLLVPRGMDGGYSLRDMDGGYSA